MYKVKNITSLPGRKPRDVSIPDIPNHGHVFLKPGEEIDLELTTTRNQILLSHSLKKAIQDNYVAVTKTVEPNDRWYVDASLSGGNITITNATIDVSRGLPAHYNGQTNGPGFLTIITITPPQKTTSLMVSHSLENVSADILSVSFDNGTNFFDIGYDDRYLSIDTEISDFLVKGSSGTVKYQILLTSK